MLAIRRLLAYGLDFMLLATVLIALQALLYAGTGGFPFDRLRTGYQIELWVLATMSLPVWLYFVCGELWLQQTIGKKLFRLQVVDKTGTRIGLLQSLIRTAVKLLPWELSHLIVLVPEPWWSVEEPTNLLLIYIPNAAIVLYIEARRGCMISFPERAFGKLRQTSGGGLDTRTIRDTRTISFLPRGI